MTRDGELLQIFVLNLKLGHFFTLWEFSIEVFLCYSVQIWTKGESPFFFVDFVNQGFKWYSFYCINFEGKLKGQITVSLNNQQKKITHSQQTEQK